MARSPALRNDRTRSGRIARASLGRPGFAATVECCLSLPVIFIALLRQQGWPVAAFAHRTDPGAWCIRINKSSLMTLDKSGAMKWQGIQASNRVRLEAALAQAQALHASIARSSAVLASDKTA